MYVFVFVISMMNSNENEYDIRLEIVAVNGKNIPHLLLLAKGDISDGSSLWPFFLQSRD